MSLTSSSLIFFLSPIEKSYQILTDIKMASSIEDEKWQEFAVHSPDANEELEEPKHGQDNVNESESPLAKEPKEKQSPRFSIDFLLSSHCDKQQLQLQHKTKNDTKGTSA